MPSISASALSISLSTVSRPSAVFRSAVSERLPRFIGFFEAFASPVIEVDSARSTAMTSAPRSARCMEQKGPGPIPQISTILIPDSINLPLSSLGPRRGWNSFEANRAVAVHLLPAPGGFLRNVYGSHAPAWEPIPGRSRVQSDQGRCPGKRRRGASMAAFPRGSVGTIKSAPTCRGIGRWALHPGTPALRTRWSPRTRWRPAAGACRRPAGRAGYAALPAPADPPRSH
ncbi:hypothetical protein D3C80_1237400 [compost metagenome]